MTDALQRLREPFPDEQVGKLPRVWCAKCRDLGKGRACDEHSITKCKVCGNKGTTGHLHLDFVGHAEVTHRLLDVDPEWTWEPFLGADGQPLVVTAGKELNLWIRLTIGGVTRPGVGVVAVGANDAYKQLISDALRNAAMRFGVALDLWAKSDLDHKNPEAALSDPGGAPSEDGTPTHAAPGGAESAGGGSAGPTERLTATEDGAASSREPTAGGGGPAPAEPSVAPRATRKRGKEAPKEDSSASDDTPRSGGEAVAAGEDAAAADPDAQELLDAQVLRQHRARLQAQKDALSTEARAALVPLWTAAGLPRIEALDAERLNEAERLLAGVDGG